MTAHSEFANVNTGHLVWKVLDIENHISYSECDIGIRYSKVFPLDAVRETWQPKLSSLARRNFKSLFNLMTPKVNSLSSLFRTDNLTWNVGFLLFKCFFCTMTLYKDKESRSEDLSGDFRTQTGSRNVIYSVNSPHNHNTESMETSNHNLPQGTKTTRLLFCLPTNRLVNWYKQSTVNTTLWIQSRHQRLWGSKEGVDRADKEDILLLFYCFYISVRVCTAAYGHICM